jgi:valyl-tRNA synthetase
LKSVVSALRRIRSELNVAPSRHVALLLQDGTGDDRRRASSFAQQIGFLARTESIAWLDANAQAPAASAALIGDLKLLIPLAGLIDLDAERARLAKEIVRVTDEIAKSENKLAKFGDKAPAAVIEQERTRLTDWTAQRDALHAQAQRLADA